MGIRLFFIGLIVTALAGGGFYVMKLQKDNAILKANAIKLESAISDQKTLIENQKKDFEAIICLLYTSPSPRDVEESRMPSSA